MEEQFRLAPMSPSILVLTIVLLVVPTAILIAAISATSLLYLPFGLLAGIYAWVWLRFRPGRFVLLQNALEVIWPLKRRRLSFVEISDVRLIDGPALKKEIGWSVRIGAGGLWGGFGWL